MDFIPLDRITVGHVGKAILDFYEVSEIDIKTCVGQCYDGAANMQSQKQGAASSILKKSLKAIVCHSYLHKLNLVLLKSTKLPINNLLKKERLLEHVASKSIAQESLKKVLIGKCKTRWSEQNATCENFYLALPFIVKSLEVILNSHVEMYKCNANYKRKAFKI